MKLLVILGSVRDGRFGATVADWHAQFRNETKFDEVEVVDLLKENLPLTLEEIPPSQGRYSKDSTKTWAAKVAAADAFVFLTPEYNHGTSAAMKNAIDTVFAEWNYKPVGLIGWGSRGGVRAIEQLLPVFREVRLVPLREEVSIFPWGGDVTEDGQIKSESAEQSAKKQLEVLFEYAQALKPLREKLNT